MPEEEGSCRVVVLLVLREASGSRSSGSEEGDGATADSCREWCVRRSSVAGGEARGCWRYRAVARQAVLVESRSGIAVAGWTEDTDRDGADAGTGIFGCCREARPSRCAFVFFSGARGRTSGWMEGKGRGEEGLPSAQPRDEHANTTAQK